MSRTDISGTTFPLVIDQADITAPDFPRPADWWRRFIPVWISVDVRDDGTVALDYSGIRPTLTPSELRHGRTGMVRWLGSALGRHLRPAEVADNA